MPELPEVETIRRQLEPQLRGRAIATLEVLDPRWTRPFPPGEVAAAVAGRRIEGLDRRGKYLLLRLNGDETLVMHLRMTGNLLLIEEERPDEKYLRARIRLDDGRELRFTDPRRFGEAFVLGPAALEERFRGRLGVEPLSEEFTVEELGRAAAGSRAPLKSFLLNQARLAGVGNIYADEALFRARLHPVSPAGSMREEHLVALRDGVVAALLAGLDGGGASIDDYRDSRGERGAMQDEFLVHRREGEPCPRCGETIRRIVVGGRSTYYCPGCQVRLRRRPGRRRARAARSG
jgi:formamidopyrimidine-DNA glycosylase